ncbi:hypothetical protein [Phreatobacter sp.]|uniref:hypothetical protein n=1 Tax=Phreatobacter sp. TaxID=1966341 RepID=UPI002604B001|nr:hypothetical protein [Phreatobacter sp.]
MSYDPATERAVARRLRGARWRRLAFFVSAIAVAAAAAAAFTHAHRDTVAAFVPPPAPPAPIASPAPAAPSLASSTSRPVTLPGDAADPNKVQARIVVPADPEPAAAPIQMQAPPATARMIPLSTAVPAEAPRVEDSTPPAAALGFAPLPPPRPSRAP